PQKWVLPMVQLFTEDLDIETHAPAMDRIFKQLSNQTRPASRCSVRKTAMRGQTSAPSNQVTISTGRASEIASRNIMRCAVRWSLMMSLTMNGFKTI
ncbi:hypothetical protein FRC00_006417, partial [Tulasnella sp. 408]